VASQSTDRVFDSFRDLGEGLTRSDVLLRILTDLTVNLSALTVLCQEVVVHTVEVALLFVGGTVGIVVQVLADLTLGVLVVGEEIRDGDTRRLALNLGTTLLLLLRLALLLLFGG
jgi:hypothetical protein